LFWIVTCCTRWFLTLRLWHGYMRFQVNMTWNKVPHHHTTISNFFQFFFPYIMESWIFFFMMPHHNKTTCHGIQIFFPIFIENKFWHHSPWCTCLYIGFIWDTFMHTFFKVSTLNPMEAHQGHNHQTTSKLY